MEATQKTPGSVGKRVTHMLSVNAIIDVSIRQIWSYVNLKHAKAYLRRCTSYKGLCRLRGALPIIRLILSDIVQSELRPARI